MTLARPLLWRVRRASRPWHGEYYKDVSSGELEVFLKLLGLDLTDKSIRSLLRERKADVVP